MQTRLDLKGALTDGLVSTYGWLNRRGALDWPVFERVFRKAYFFYKQHLEDPFAALTRHRPDLFRAGHILDVGANIGYTAVLFAKALAPPFRVYAFEPEQKNFERLQRAIHDFGVSDLVVAEQLAIGASNGTAQLWLNQKSHADHRILTGALEGKIESSDPTCRVAMSTLDAFTEAKGIRSRVGFVKVDVQGYEHEVCEGMRQTLSASRGAIVAVEYAPSVMGELGFRGSSLIDFFRSLDFHLYELGKTGTLDPIRNEQPDVSGTGWTNLVCSREIL